MALREAGMTISTGFQGSGKTRETIETAIDMVMGNQQLGVKPRNFLILDYNNEFEQVETSRGIIHIKTLRKDLLKDFTYSPTKEIRRIIPFDKGRKYDTEEMHKMVNYIFGTYMAGGLLLEDLSGYYGDHLPDKFVSSLINLRHKNIDTFINLQSANRLVPKMRGNLKYCRFHWQSDDVDPAKVNNYALYKIAQNVVNKQYRDGIDPRTGQQTGNPFFFVYIHNEKNKISGRFSKRMFLDAILEYITQHPSTTRNFEKQRDSAGKKRYSYDECMNIVQMDLFTKHYGNDV